MTRVRNAGDRNPVVHDVEFVDRADGHRCECSRDKAKVWPGDEIEVVEDIAERLVADYGFEYVDEDDAEAFDVRDEIDLESLTYNELYEAATEYDIDGRSSMSKDELIEALYDHHES